MPSKIIYFLLAAVFSLPTALSLTASKVVVITGASQGIGLASTQYLAQRGYTVCAGLRKTSSRTALEGLAQQYPDHVMLVEIDVSDQSTIDATCKTILDRFGRIDVLVNNACEILVGAIETQTIAEQQRTMDVNYFGPVRMIQAIAPVMRKQHSGTIINISSVAGIEPFPHMDSYVASKFALESLSESLATTLSPWHINVCLIEPGAVHTQGPANMQLGTRINDDTACFANFNQTAFAFMRSRLLVPANEPGFSQPIEIAQCIEQIITTEKPFVRYQVGPDAPLMAAKRFVDPTGNSYVEAKKKQLTNRGFMQALQAAAERQ